MIRRPNVVMILTDDHAAQAISAYGSVVNATPRIDEIAGLGRRFGYRTAMIGKWHMGGTRSSGRS